MSNKRAFKQQRGVSRGPRLEVADAGRRPLILSLDTATGARSVAVTRGATALSLVACDSGASNATAVLSDIAHALGESGVIVGQIGLFAAAAGPGSFTGLRSGLATVKGLAMTLDKPAIGIQTLHAVGHAAGPAQSLMALIPAGRGEVFAQHLGLSEDGTVSEYSPPAHIAPELLIERAVKLGGRLKWAGSGAVKYLELILEAARREGIEVIRNGSGGGKSGGRVWELTAGPRDLLLAQSVALLALGAYRSGVSSNVRELKAIYVRPADAKLPVG